jgi:ABC-type glycerol-3-phosphate transport system substrate-binding protein
MSRIINIVVFLVVFTIFLFSCKSEKEDISKTTFTGKSSIVQTKVRWLGQWYNEGKKETLIREMAKEFEFLNQDIDIELVFPYQMAGIDSSADPFRPVADSILSWVREDRWPFDIFVCDKWFYEDVAKVGGDEYWGQKNLVDFKNEKWFRDSHKEYVLNSTEYIGNFGDIAPGAFIEGAWDLVYVSSVVENKLGIHVKEYDMSIDDFTEYAKIVHQFNQTHVDKITFCATNYKSMELIISHLIMSELGNVKEHSSEEQLQAIETVYKKLEILSQYDPLAQPHVYANDRELKQDKALFHLHTTWVNMFWQRSNPEGEKLMRPCEFPSMKGKVAQAYAGTYNAIFAIPKKAKNKEAAIRFMKYMSTVDIAEKWENYSKCPTGLKSRISINEFGTDAFGNLSKHISKKYDNRLADSNLAKDLFNGTQKQVNFHALEVIGGNMTTTQAMNSIRSQMR